MSRAGLLVPCLIAMLAVAGCSSASDAPQPSALDAAAADSTANDAAEASEPNADATGGTTDAPSDASPADAGPCGKRDEPCCGGATCESGLKCTSLPGGHLFCLCDTSLCDRFGYVCDGNTQVGCGPTAPGSCYVPITTKACPADSPCDPATGTCGGCDASDPCAGKADGTFLGCKPFVAQWCRKAADGCAKTVDEKCGIACVGGARQGCCGGEGQMCCSPPGAPCIDGLSCKGEACAK